MSTKFVDGQQVVINGTLFSGKGVVRWFCDDGYTANGMDGMDIGGKEVKIRWGQPFPQLVVDAENGKSYHYNGDDIEAGKIQPKREQPTSDPGTDELAKELEQLEATAARLLSEDCVQAAPPTLKLQIASPIGVHMTQIKVGTPTTLFVGDVMVQVTW